MLGNQDIKRAYRRSALGPFWVTAGMALQIATIGVVFGILFKAEAETYLPYLAVSIISWGFISGVINDASIAFSSSEAIIKQTDVPKHVFIVRLLWKNVLIYGHHLIILPVVFALTFRAPNLSLFLLVPGLIILLLNLSWISLVLATVSARYRDLPPITSSLMGIFFYVTPVIWTPNLLGDPIAQHLLLGLNPLYHFLQIVRLPILGESPTFENWAIASFVAVTGWIFASIVFKKYSKMIAYWV
jgi:ABC-type polysaccharide/polyol phosphate export permease